MSELQGHTVCPAFILLPPGYYVWPSPRHHSFWVPLHSCPSYCTRMLLGSLLLGRWLRLRKSCFALTWKRLPGPAPSPLVHPGTFPRVQSGEDWQSQGSFQLTLAPKKKHYPQKLLCFCCLLPGSGGSDNPEGTPAPTAVTL